MACPSTAVLSVVMAAGGLIEGCFMVGCSATGMAERRWLRIRLAQPLLEVAGLKDEVELEAAAGVLTI